jgi:hypothetical protein
MLNEYVNTNVVVEHISKVIEEKTIQLTDHLINKATLENKLKDYADVPEEAKEKYEAILQSLAGKNQTQHEKIVSKLEPAEKINLQDYVNHKRDVDNFEFAEKGIKEHEDFLKVVTLLKQSLEREMRTSSTSDTPVEIK